MTGSADGRLRVWDMSTGSLEKLVGSATGKAVRSLAMFSYGVMVAAPSREATMGPCVSKTCRSAFK